MESLNFNSLNRRQDKEGVMLNPQFEDLQNPKTLLNHVQEITTTKVTSHTKILTQLIKQFEPLDFEAMANPHNAENFKLTNKHYTVLTIENVLQTAENNRWAYVKITISFTCSMLLTGMNSIKKLSKSF